MSLIHRYQSNGYNIVLDSCSGSIHVVDEVAYDIIALFQDHSPDEIVAAMLEKYGELPLVFSGGVMSNTIIREKIGSRFPAHFASAEFSCDNAAGVAIIGYLKNKQ